MISRRHVVAGAVATLALPAKAEAASLRELAAARGLIFGSAAASYELKDADFVAALTRDAAQLVPEYEMKRDVLQPEPGRYDFTNMDRLFAFARGAKAAGFKVIIAGAGGAAHLPGMTAALTELPVLGVPVESKALSGVDSLYSIVQMPAGVPVGTLAIGKAGAINAALLAASVLALNYPALATRLAAWRKQQTEAVGERPEEKA